MGWLAGILGITTLIGIFSKDSSSDDNDTEAQEPESLSVTSTDLGTPIPVVLGTCILKNSLTVYWGDFFFWPYTETYGGSSDNDSGGLRSTLSALALAAIALCFGSPGVGALAGALIAIVMWIISMFNSGEIKTTIQKGFLYYLGYQQILCWAHPNARLKRVWIEENLVWEGDEPASNHTDGSPFKINVSNLNLFGGPDENGGFVGCVNIYFGGDNQEPDPWMIKEMSKSSIQQSVRGKSPAYRPFISAVVPKSYIGKKATVPKMWYEIEIVSDSLKTIANDYGIRKIADETGIAEADIIDFLNNKLSINGDINPFEAMNEIVTNNNWGLNERNTYISISSTIKSAMTVYDEKLYISLQMTSLEKARDIVDRICEHVNAVHYLDETKAKIVYKLIRGDYFNNGSRIKEITESNCSNITFVREDWETTVSSIYVTFTARDNLYETGTVSVDDIANIEIQDGSTSTKSYSRPYFTNAANALWAANNLLKVSAFPLSCITVDLDRRFFDIRIGDVLLVNFPSFGIKNEFVRVTSFTDNDFISGTIHLEAIEDVFALEKSEFNYTDITEWEPEPIYPTGAQYFLFMEMPYEIVHTCYTYVYAYCCRPTVNEVAWHVWREPPNGTFYISSDMSKWSATGFLVYDYNEDTASIDRVGIEVRGFYGFDDYKNYMRIKNLSQSGHPRNGAYIMLINDEIMSFGSLDQLPNGNWLINQVIRGTYDTVPANHKATDRVFLIQQGNWTNVSPRGYIGRIGEIVTERYNITTSTPLGDEVFDSNKIQSLTTVRRTERPSVQGRVRINAHLVVDEAYPKELAGDIHMTWEDRNKFLYPGCFSQDDIGDYITGTTLVMPNGIKYNTEIYIDGNYIRGVTGSTKRYFDYTWVERIQDNPNLSHETKIVTYSTLNGLESLQRQSRTFKWKIPLFIGIVRTEADGKNLVRNMDNLGTIYIPNTTYSKYQSVEYGDMPIVLIGTASGLGTIIGYDGLTYAPTGDMMVFTDVNTYTKIPIPVGFIGRSITYSAGTSVLTKLYYKWDGTKMIPVVVS